MTTEEKSEYPALEGVLKREIVLASGSPHRARLLREARVPFRVEVSNVDEDLHPMDTPEKYAMSLAQRKAQAVAAKVEDAIVIGADTVCAVNNEVVGKPLDEEDAVKIISHACQVGMQRVITGIALIDSRNMKTLTHAVTSLVEMRDVPEALIRAYVATGEPMGKAGALCIEGNHDFVKRFEGSYSNIVGLPLEWLLPELLKMAN